MRALRRWGEYEFEKHYVDDYMVSSHLYIAFRPLNNNALFNRPDFIEWQYKSFKQFLRDTYQYIDFNDAQDTARNYQINELCNLLGVRCIGAQTDRGKPRVSSLSVSSWRHSQAIAYSMNELGFNRDGLVMLIDSDMFLIKGFSVTDFLNYDIAGIRQVREE